METFSLTFTVHEWRVIAASIAFGGKHLYYPHDKTLAKELSHKIATQTGKYDSEGKSKNN
jgi:hypothetical protein